ncbi:Transcription initiation factor TFIID subunit 12 [Umbelopsis nana]
MSQAPQQTPPNMIQQYQRALEIYTNYLGNVRTELQKTTLSAEERERMQAQEKDYQEKITMFQTVLNNISASFTAQMRPGQAVNLQQQQQYAQQLHQSQAATMASANQQRGKVAIPNASTASAAANDQNKSVPTTPVSAKAQLYPFNVNSAVSQNGESTSTPTGVVPAAPTNMPKSGFDPDSNQVLGKRKIQELVGQIDPNERLEPEVEDILLEIADEFIESVTTFACRLAKHRKSDTLEVKDLQLHLERNWNIRIPGFASDEVRSLRKPVVPPNHQSRLQAVNLAKSQSAPSIAGMSLKKDS